MSANNEAVYSHDGPDLKFSIRVPMKMPPEDAEYFLSILELVKRQVIRRCLTPSEPEQEPTSGQEGTR